MIPHLNNINGSLMEPTPKLLAYWYVASNLMFMSKCDNRTYIYVGTWHSIPYLCQNVVTDVS